MEVTENIKKSSLQKRTISGIIYVIAMVSCISLSPYSFLGISLVLITIALWEFYSISKYIRIRPQIILGTIIGNLLFILIFLYTNNKMMKELILLIIPLIISIFIFELYRNKHRPFGNIAFTILGILYIALPISLFNFFAHFPDELQGKYNPGLILGFFVMIWTNDTGAYILGEAIGRNKLFNRISGKKTWEGALGGLLATFFIAYILSVNFTTLSLFQWFGMAAIISIIGNFSDLVESMYKRNLQIKDTGKIMPGHGGILDRIDSTLLSAPMVYFYLEIIL